MSQAVIEEAPVTTRTPPPPLWHLVCRCQVDIEVGGRAWCGAKVGGSPTTSAGKRPMDLCVICRDLKDDPEYVCPYCKGTGEVQ